MPELKIIMTRDEIPGTGEEPGLHTEGLLSQDLRDDVVVREIVIEWNGAIFGSVPFFPQDGTLFSAPQVATASALAALFEPRDIENLDRWLDMNKTGQYQYESLAQGWGRLGNVMGELGKAADAFTGLTGQNPRKGYFYGLPDDYHAKLVDVALTALLCLQHGTKNIAKTQEIVRKRMMYQLAVAGIIPRDEE